LCALLLSASCSNKETDALATETVEQPTEFETVPAKPISKPAFEQDLDTNLHHVADHVSIYEVKWEDDPEVEAAAKMAYRIVFTKSGEVVKEFKGEVETNRGAEWGLTSDVMKSGESPHDPRFLEISQGFAACGYVWNHFLFFVDGNRISQVLTTFSSMDSGFGTSYAYKPTMQSGKAVKFAAVTVEIDEAESSTDEKTMLEIKYSDSTNYEFLHNSWKPTLITPKGTVYRREVRSFDDYYNQAGL